MYFIVWDLCWWDWGFGGRCSRRGGVNWSHGWALANHDGCPAPPGWVLSGNEWTNDSCMECSFWACLCSAGTVVYHTNIFFNFINKDGNLFVSSRIDCFVLIPKTYPVYGIIRKRSPFAKWYCGVTIVTVTMFFLSN